jgi:hypothetical protein
VGRPRKIPDKDKRETIARDYVGLCDIAGLDFVQRERPYRDDFIRAVARYHRTNARQVKRCLVEFDIRTISAHNKKFWREQRAKKKLKARNKIKDNKK